MDSDQKTQKQLDDEALTLIWTRNPDRVLRFLLKREDIVFQKIYVSIPFKSPDPEVTKRRMSAVKHYAYKLMKQGLVPFTPIISGDAIFTECNTDGELGKATWQQYCFAHLEMCSQLHVILMGETIESQGVLDEVIRASQVGIPVSYISLDEVYSEVN